MHFGTVFLASLAALAAAVPRSPSPYAADQDLLSKQQDVLHLLENIYGELPNSNLRDIGWNYDFQSKLQNYENPNAVKYYVGLVSNGLAQPRGTPFAVSVSQLRKEVALLTQMLLNAKDYQTFIYTAAWARVHVNEDQFVAAFSSAVLRFPYLAGITLPPVYEVYPQYFLDSRIIQDVYNHLSAYNPESDSGPNSPNNQRYDIYVNYTSSLPYGENQIAYFTDDIGLSAYYYYIQLASYMLPHGKKNQAGLQKDARNSIDRGANYYYIHQQLMARYNVERLGQGLGPIGELDSYYQHIQVPYKPNIAYMNGLDMPQRDQHIDITPKHHNYNLIRMASILEKRILDAVSLGGVWTAQGNFLSLYQPQGLNILGELIEGTGRSINPRYYGSFQAVARQIFGNAPRFNNIYEYNPSALELGQTAVRDPVFYQLYNKIIQLFNYYQEALPAYQYNDLVLPGVKIQRVDVSDLVTFFGDFEVSLDNAVPQVFPENEANEFAPRFIAHLKRLDCRQYQYSVYVNAEEPVAGAVVRVFVGPKYNYAGQPINVNENRNYFYQLDQFTYNLVQGQNVIVRQSQDASGQSFDFPSFQQLKNQVRRAIRSENPYYIYYPEQLYGFPARLSLPKGTKSGFPLQMLFVISSVTSQQAESYGPIVEQQFENYQPQHYQYEQRSEYQGGDAINRGRMNGISPSVEVVPEYGSSMENNEYSASSYLYSRYPGPYNYQRGGNSYTGQAGQQAANSYFAPVASFPSNNYQENDEQADRSTSALPQARQGHKSRQSQGSTKDATLEQYRYGGNKVRSYQPISQNLNSGYPESVASRGSQENYDSGRPSPYSTSSAAAAAAVSNYYKNKYIGNIIGGAISLDERPLGYPLDRPLSQSAFEASNIYLQDVTVYHIDDDYLPRN